MVNHPSVSREQQEAGKTLVNALSLKLGVPLEQERTLDFGSGCTVKIDGYSANPPILCEAWAHYGKPKGSQPYKIMTDALKLIFTEKCLRKEHRKILLFSDEGARKPFVSKNWKAQFLREYSIETKVFPLPKKQREELIEAQKRQYR